MCHVQTRFPFRKQAVRRGSSRRIYAVPPLSSGGRGAGGSDVPESASDLTAEAGADSAKAWATASEDVTEAGAPSGETGAFSVTRTGVSGAASM